MLDNGKGRPGPNGVRLLGRKTVELMTTNHLDPDGVGAGHAAAGLGFGLGVAVNIDPSICNGLGGGEGGSLGEWWWGGAAGTDFWVDPAEEGVCLYFTQLMMAELTTKTDLRIAVNAALIDPPPNSHGAARPAQAARM